MVNVGKKMGVISALVVELVGVAGFEPATPLVPNEGATLGSFEYSAFFALNRLVSFAI
jgi:hypothetical protein